MGLKGNMEITCSFFWFMGYIKSGENPRFLFAFLFVRFPLANLAYFLPHLQGKRHLYLILSFGSLFSQLMHGLRPQGGEKKDPVHLEKISVQRSRMS